MGTNTPHTCIPGLIWQKQARRFSQFELKVGKLRFHIHFVCVSAALYHRGVRGRHFPLRWIWPIDWEIWQVYANYRKRGSASYYRKRGSASYIVREVLLVRERERYRERKRDRRKWRHHCRAKIGDEFTLSLAKNSHNWRWAYTLPCQKLALFVSHFTLPVSPLTERSPRYRWRWNSQWVHTFHCQICFRPQALFPLFQMAWAARRVIENPRQMIKSCPVPFCSSHRKTESN